MYLILKRSGSLGCAENGLAVTQFAGVRRLAALVNSAISCVQGEGQSLGYHHGVRHRRPAHPRRIARGRRPSGLVWTWGRGEWLVRHLGLSNRARAGVSPWALPTTATGLRRRAYSGNHRTPLHSDYQDGRQPVCSVFRAKVLVQQTQYLQQQILRNDAGNPLCRRVRRRIISHCPADHRGASKRLAGGNG
jgi:hypothetical protein